MAQHAATFSVYDMIGIKEDVDDTIYRVSQEDTPFVSGLSRGKAENRRVEWQTDALRAARANAQIEGDDATYYTRTPTVLLHNQTQIMSDAMVVSGTARSVDTYGREEELAYQIMKEMAALKLDVEFNTVRNTKIDVGTDTTARQLGGLESWLSSNVRKAGSNSASTTPGYSGGALAAPTDGTNMSTFLESDLRFLQTTIWTAGGKPSVLMINGANKALFSRTFTGIAALQRQIGDKQNVSVAGSAGFYDGDFGILKVLPNPQQRGRTAFLLDMSKFRLDVLRSFRTEPLAKTGDADKRMILTELTLVSKNEKASGKIVDILDSY